MVDSLAAVPKCSQAGQKRQKLTIENAGDASKRKPNFLSAEKDYLAVAYVENVDVLESRDQKSGSNNRKTMKYVEIAEAFNIVYPRVLRTYTEVRTVLKNMRDEVRKLPHAKKPPTGGGPALPPLPEGWQSTLLPIVKEHPATNGLDAALESGVNELDVAQTEHAERRIHSDAVDVDTTEVEINNSNSENASLPPTVSTASTLWRPRSNSNPERKLVMPPWNVIGAASNRTLKLTATEYGDSDEDHEDEAGQSPNADKKQGKANIGKARIQQKESELLELESSRIRLDLQKLNLECEKLRSEKEMLDSKNAVYLIKYELLKHKYSELGYSS